MTKYRRMKFLPDQTEIVSDMVARRHYLRTVPRAAKLYCGWFEPGGILGDHGLLAAAMILAHPRGRWKDASGILEISRLCRHPDYKDEDGLTQFLSEMKKYVQRKQLADLLLAYADPREDHHGGVYQAASYNYHGKRRSRSVGVKVAGGIIHERTIQSQKKFKEDFGEHFTGKAVYDEGMHLYWIATGGRGRKKASDLGLKRTPYPKGEA